MTTSLAIRAALDEPAAPAAFAPAARRQALRLPLTPRLRRRQAGRVGRALAP